MSLVAILNHFLRLCSQKKEKKLLSKIEKLKNAFFTNFYFNVLQNLKKIRKGFQNGGN
jgi:hypothetical protein